jgi:hypothetical protein
LIKKLKLKYILKALRSKATETPDRWRDTDRQRRIKEPAMHKNHRRHNWKTRLA